MKIIHISDTHGSFPAIPESKDSESKDSESKDFQSEESLIVHSGDMQPNSPTLWGVSGLRVSGLRAPSIEAEVEFQEKWMRQRIQKFADWIGQHTFMYCPGNHDYYDPVPLMQRAGIKAISIDQKWENHSDYLFYGFPYVPQDCFPWNYAVPNQEMSGRLDTLASQWNEKTVKEIGSGIVLVAHCPPAGVMDMCPRQIKRFGNSNLNDFLNYKITVQPKFLLCGHIHGAGGIQKYSENFGPLVSQAATIVNTIDVYGKS